VWTAYLHALVSAKGGGRDAHYPLHVMPDRTAHWPSRKQDPKHLLRSQSHCCVTLKVWLLKMVSCLGRWQRSKRNLKNWNFWDVAGGAAPDFSGERGALSKALFSAWPTSGRHYDLSKLRELLPQRHRVTSHKTWLLSSTAVGTSSRTHWNILSRQSNKGRQNIAQLFLTSHTYTMRCDFTSA